MNIMSIDPGLRHLGWAIFSHGDLIKSGEFVCNRKDFWLKRLDWLVDRVVDMAKEHRVGLVVIEEPELFLRSFKGSSASASGSVLKLSALVYSIRACVPCEVELFKPSKWKGQVPKHIMHKRLGLEKVSTHSHDEADAIALGLWYLRKCL